MLTRVLLVIKNPFFKSGFGKGVKAGRVEDNYYNNKILNSKCSQLPLFSCHWNHNDSVSYFYST